VLEPVLVEKNKAEEVLTVGAAPQVLHMLRNACTAM